MYLFDYLGAFYYWVFLKIFNFFYDGKAPTFKEVRVGKDKHQEGNIADLQAYGMRLKFIGLVVTMIIVSILAKI